MLTEHLLSNMVFGLKHHFTVLLQVPAITFILALYQTSHPALGGPEPSCTVGDPTCPHSSISPSSDGCSPSVSLPVPESFRLILPSWLFLPSHCATPQPTGYELSLLSDPCVDFQAWSPCPNLRLLLGCQPDPLSLLLPDPHGRGKSLPPPSHNSRAARAFAMVGDTGRAAGRLSGTAPPFVPGPAGQRDAAPG